MANAVNKMNGDGDEQRLAARLRREALAARPEFDEKLHARIMEAVDPWSHPVAIYRDPRASTLRRVTASPWLAASVAASLLVAVGAIALQLSRPAPPAAAIVRYQAVPPDAGSVRHVLAAPAHEPRGTTLPDAGSVRHVAAPEQEPRPEAIAEVETSAVRGTPSMMALAVTDPLKGFTLRTSQLPLTAATRLGQLREANNRFAAELVRDQLASLDHDARQAASMLFGTAMYDFGPDQQLDLTPPPTP